MFQLGSWHRLSQSEFDVVQRHMQRSLYGNDAERIDICLCDTYYSEDVVRIRGEPTHAILPGRGLGDGYESEVE